MGRAISYPAMLKLLLPEDWRQAGVFQVGLEREMLRLDPQQQLANTPHPLAWGSPLTHPDLTLDFAGCQPELVSPPHGDTDSLLSYLQDLHAFAVQNLPAGESLWFPSMPPALSDEQIQPAEFGSSNSGYLKHVYRRGLANRYGKKMQVISGVHFNFSWQDAFWQRLHERVGDSRRVSVFRSENYLALMRNYLRLSWMLAYLIGASPAIDSSFLKRQSPELQPWKDRTLYGPYATSLRMSRIGYVNSTRCSASVNYNSVTDYLSSLYQAITTECPGFVLIGTQNDDGSWRQLNTHLLQIENEHYALIRPKQVPNPGERPFQAVRDRGVSYVEIRAIDNQPDSLVGVHPEQLDMMRLLLLYCLLHPNPTISREAEQENSHNHQQAALLGRQPGVSLRRNQSEISLQDWGLEVVADMQPLAELLDHHQNTERFASCLRQMETLFRHPEQTPSARVWEQMASANLEYTDWGLACSEQRQRALAQHPLSPERQAWFAQRTQASVQAQQELEAAPQAPFADYLRQHSQLKTETLSET